MPTPNEIVNTMMANDSFSQWLGISVMETGIGKSKLQMTVRQEMLNGHGTVHGGITYSFADSALAFASNSHGKKAVSIETSISHTKPVKVGDLLIAETKEESCSNKIGIYTITVYRMPDSEVVALFKGTVYRTSKEW